MQGRHKMFLKSNKEIFLSIDRTTTCQDHGTPILMAIAYWGKGADEKLKSSHEYKIICNLTDGGTNPSTIDNIRKMKNVELKHLERLHAKVVIGSKYTIVGSANFSENGLGYGSAINAGQYEAALQIATEPVHSDWFDELWNKASIVSDSDISKAFEAWQNTSIAGRGTDDTYQAPMAKPNAELIKDEILCSDITQKNQTLMASRKLVRIYLETFEPDKLEDEQKNKYARRFPAHAANFIWILAGHSVPVRFEVNGKIINVEQMFERMEELGTTNRVLEFLELLAEMKDKRLSLALKYWAGKSAEKLTILRDSR